MSDLSFAGSSRAHLLSVKELLYHHHDHEGGQEDDHYHIDGHLNGSRDDDARFCQKACDPCPVHSTFANFKSLMIKVGFGPKWTVAIGYWVTCWS